jgi:hypothetical protein
LTPRDPVGGSSAAERTRTERHRRWHALLSERLDRALTADDHAALEAHLAECGRCRTIERAYLEEQRSLRSLNEVPPPRDLWARTSTALDREITRETRSSPGVIRMRAGSGSASMLVLSTIAVTTLALAAVGARIVADRERVAADPTASTQGPGQVGSAGSQELAVVNVGPDGGLGVYQAAVGLSCPQPVAECDLDAVATHQFLDVPTGQRPVELSLHIGTRRLAVLAENARGMDTVSVVNLPPLDDGGASRGAGPGPDGRWPQGLGPNQSFAIGDPGTGIASPDAADPTDRLLAVLDGVRVTGAAPAWSPDGGLLAFSAMPMDRSRGPDLYVWRAGEHRARKLTNDHRTWFASWSRSRIVVSRTAPSTDRVGVRTVLIDPATRRERNVRLDDAWLPVVDPGGRFALAWRGTLGGDLQQPRPRIGSVYLVDWASIDPSQAGRTGSARLAGESDRAAPPRGGARTRTGGARSDTRSQDSGAGQPRAEGWLEAVEPERDARLHPLLDWEVRWADDGRSFGYWVADAPGATWGQLVVQRVDQAGAIDRTATILGPTLARRSFTLGITRVAWVAPVTDRPDGELRVRTWSGAGATFRIRDIDTRNGILAF